MGKIDYGKITKINSIRNSIVSYGDYGIDKDNNIFTFTYTGWKPVNQATYEAYYWKKKYYELKNQSQTA